MARLAIVENGVVVNIVVGDTGGIDVTGLPVGPGWTYDGEMFYPPPPTPEPDPEPKRWTSCEFISEFTMTERAAILAAVQTDPAIASYILTLQVARKVSADNADTIAGLQYLEAQGYIGTGRADEILGGYNHEHTGHNQGTKPG